MKKPNLASVSDREQVQLAGVEYLTRWNWLPVIAYGVDNGVCQCRRGKECSTPGKHPIHDKWHLTMPTAAQVAEWFEPWPDANIGVAMGPRSGIIDIETDCDEGEEWLADLWEGKAPATATFRSGRVGGGGLHRLYQFRADLPLLGNKKIILGTKQGGDYRHIADLKLGNGVDEVTGQPKGSQSIFPPSMHSSGHRYKWVISPEDSPPAALPDWVAVKLVALCRPPAPPAPPPFTNSPQAVERCRKFVAKMPPAISGQGGHDQTLQVACETVRFALSDSDAAAVMAEYNARCQPQWSERDLAHKLADAKVKAAGEFGSRLNESRATPPPPTNGSAAKPAKHEPKPSPIDQYKPFPLVTLPSLAAEYIQAGADSIDVDPAKVAVALLATASGAIGNSVRIRPKPDYSESAMLWLGSMGYSGDRKSPPTDLACRPIRRRDGEEIRRYRDAAADHADAILKHKAAIKAWEKEQSQKGAALADPPAEPAAPIERRFVIEDATVEKLAAMLQSNPRGVVRIQDELAGFFAGQNQYKSGSKGSDEQDYLSIFGSRPWRKDRKAAGGSVYVPLPFVSIVGTIQPEVLRRCLTRDRLESGMAARFLLAWPPPRQSSWSEVYVDDALQDRYAGMIDRLLGIPLSVDPITDEPQPAMLPLSPAAKALFVPWHNQHEAERIELDGPLSAAWSKLTGYSLRLALVIELLEWAQGTTFGHPGVVSERSMASGIALSEWFGDEGKRIYGMLDESDGTRDRRELIEYIERHGRRITEHQLAHGPRRYRVAELATSALQGLVDAGDGEWQTVAPSEHGGRAVREFCLRTGPTTPVNRGNDGGSSATTKDSNSQMEGGQWEF